MSTVLRDKPLLDDSPATTPWFRDRQLIDALPFRYRAYAAYWRLVAKPGSRRARGGSFLLRMLRSVSRALRLSSVVPIHGIDGLVVLVDFSDERILEVIYEIRGENPEYRAMSALITAGDTFIDVGANFGTFSLLASRLVGPSGKVVAIEPQRRLAGLISESARRSGLLNCEVAPAAAGRAEGELTLLVPREFSGRAGMFADFSGRYPHDAMPVPVVTVDSLAGRLPDNGSVLIKIDVEGSEFDVLEGARRLIAERRPAVLIELNQLSSVAAGKSPAELIDLLRSLGYTSFSSVCDFSFEAREIDLAQPGNLVAWM